MLARHDQARNAGVRRDTLDETLPKFFRRVYNIRSKRCTFTPINCNLTMNLSKEQKTVIKSLVLFVIISIVVDTVMSLCKGSFNLSDTLLYSLFIILGGIGLAVFYILGMKTPKK